MLKQFADWTDRVATGELPAAQPLRPQGVERNVVVTLWDWSRPQGLPARRDLDRQAQPDGQRLRQALRRDRGEHRSHPGARPEGARRHRDEAPGARSGDAVVEGAPAWRLRLIGAKSRSGTATPRRTTRCSTSRAASGSRRACGRRAIRTSAARIDHPRPSFPLESANRHLSMYDPKSGKFTLISTCFTTHHLAFAEDANHTLWTSAGRSSQTPCSAGSTARCSRRPATSRKRKAGRRSCSTPTATASATTTSSRASRSIRPRTSAWSPGLYSVGVNPNDGTVWGTSLGFPGYVVRRQSRSGSVAHRAHRRSTSRRCRATARAAATSTATACSGRRFRAGTWRASTARKCKGPLNGPDRDRQALPGRLDALLHSRDRSSRASNPAAPRRATTPGSTSSTRSASAATCRSPPAT